jgi:hypothetical protein
MEFCCPLTLVTSDAHPGLPAVISATLPQASWQRCRTHDARDLLTTVPKSVRPWGATLPRTIVRTRRRRGRRLLDRVVAAPHPRCRRPRPTAGTRRTISSRPSAVGREIRREAFRSNPKARLNRRSGGAPTWWRRPRAGLDPPPRRRGGDGTDRRVDRPVPLDSPRGARQDHARTAPGRGSPPTFEYGGRERGGAWARITRWCVRRASGLGRPCQGVRASRAISCARVSSHDQSADLDRRVARLCEWATTQGMAVSEVVTDLPRVGPFLPAHGRAARRCSRGD